MVQGKGEIGEHPTSFHTFKPKSKSKFSIPRRGGLANIQLYSNFQNLSPKLNFWFPGGGVNIQLHSKLSKPKSKPKFPISSGGRGEVGEHQPLVLTSCENLGWTTKIWEENFPPSLRGCIKDSLLWRLKISTLSLVLAMLVLYGGFRVEPK